MSRFLLASAIAVMLAAGCASPGNAPAARQQPLAQPLAANAAPLTEPAQTGTRFKRGNSDRSVRTLDGRSMRLDTIDRVGAPTGANQ